MGNPNIIYLDLSAVDDIILDINTYIKGITDKINEFNDLQGNKAYSGSYATALGNYVASVRDAANIIINGLTKLCKYISNAQQQFISESGKQADNIASKASTVSAD